MAERLSTRDDTLISSYADHILRYRFARDYCSGMRVLDAGCGIGYGSLYLAMNGAKSVLGIDISDEALNEAMGLFQSDNLKFKKMNVEEIGPHLGQFDTIVNFENIEHISNPEKLVAGAHSLLETGTFITSTPNGAISDLDESGNPANKFHVREFTADEFVGLLSPHFRSVNLFGQWLTHGGKLRKLRMRQTFDDLNEIYYNPANRAGRLVKKLMGRASRPPPNFYGGADSLDGDYVIRSLERSEFPWPPAVLLAVCTNKRV